MKNEKLTTIFILMFALNSICFSQVEWAPINSTWTYSNYLTDTVNTNYTTIECIGDTIIEGVENKILEIENTIDCTNFNSKIYTHKTLDNKIMVKINQDEEHFMLYDFNANIGDSWNIPININSIIDTLTYTITDINEVDIDGIERKLFSVNRTYRFNNVGNTHPSEVILEGVGDVGFLLPWQLQNCETTVYNGNLSCYYDESTSIINLTNDPVTCGSTTAVTEFIANDKIKIFPNPATNRISIEAELNFGNFEIIQLNGSTIMQGSLVENNIDLLGLPGGMYLLKLSTEEGSIIVKKMVVE